MGDRERDTADPLPEHISARAEDLNDRMRGLLHFNPEPSRALAPVLAAACLAFGFVCSHPFVDGNGRQHCYLIHHVLAERRFNPPELIFPVSAAILREIDAYRRVLESRSKAVLPFIEWEPKPQGNLVVRNDTADLYRYFDATPHAEFLYPCVAEAIDRDLPEGAESLLRHDRVKGRVQEMVEMPAATLDLLVRLLRQNGGRLSARATEGESAALAPQEVERIEEAWAGELGEWGV